MAETPSQLHLDRLIHFHAVAKQGSLKRAAAVLYLTPPALTRSLQKLEDELGFVLCRRGRRGLQLTDEGRRLLRTTEQVVATLQGYLDAVDTLESYSGIVALGFLDSLRLPRLDAAVEAMIGAFPECKLSFIVAGSSDLALMVENEELDLSFSVFDRFRPGLRYRQVASGPFRYYIGSKHALFSRQRITRSDLDGERVVWIDHEPVDRSQLEAQVFRDPPGQAMRVTAFSNHLEWGLKLLLAGYAVVPPPRSFVREQLASGEVRELSARPPFPETATHCADKPDRPGSPPVAFLLDRLGLGASA